MDLKITNDGDLVVGANGDLEVVWGDEQIAQEVLFRLKTTIGDWTLSPGIGASLERFIGQPNTPITHSLMEVKIGEALTKGNLLVNPSVRAAALSENEVFILIEFRSLEDDNRVVQLQSVLDTRKGSVFSRSTTRET